jgi:FtsH-binding integral membrane protein
MLRENRDLLLIGSLYWMGLFVLVNGFAASALTENGGIAAGTVVVTLIVWAAAIAIGYRGRDRYGKVRSGIDRGR